MQVRSKDGNFSLLFFTSCLQLCFIPIETSLQIDLSPGVDRAGFYLNVPGRLRHACMAAMQHALETSREFGGDLLTAHEACEPTCSPALHVFHI